MTHRPISPRPSTFFLLAAFHPPSYAHHLRAPLNEDQWWPGAICTHQEPPPPHQQPTANSQQWSAGRRCQQEPEQHNTTIATDYHHHHHHHPYVHPEQSAIATVQPHTPYYDPIAKGGESTARAREVRSPAPPIESALLRVALESRDYCSTGSADPI
ncbi:hypothetical protein GY45DRAFT_774812 [Cubamyces sp. BRFM 1775]|nr:hypothetical protein GY45DRAFT_774812 [Cubamyces sp. BRFM 1775]